MESSQQDADVPKNATIKPLSLTDYIKESEQEKFLETVSGQIYTHLKKQGERDGKEVRVEQGRYGREIFHYGDETALKQVHIEPSGLAKRYTNMLDLQKPWWNKALLEITEHGQLEKLGLIAPSVDDALTHYFSDETGQKFNLKNLMQAAGKTVAHENAQDSMLYAKRPGSNPDLEKCIKLLEVFWTKLVTPHYFKIEFSDGGGDLFRNLRLIPTNPETQYGLIYGHGYTAKKALQKIVDSYEETVKHIRENI